MSVECASTRTDAHYIDTRPGRENVFSPPEQTDNYSAWLTARYNSSLGNGTHHNYGVAQRVQSMINQQKQSKGKICVTTLGPHAEAAAKTLIEISDGLLNVDILG